MPRTPAPAAPRTDAPPVSSYRTTAHSPSPTAALEVDRFLWPATCDALIDGAADLESLAAMLANEASAGSQAIAVAATDEGEGATTVALCLARILASRGVRMCLVDGDVHRPQLAESLGLEPECGLEAVLAGEATLCEVLIESLEDRLTLLPLAGPVPDDVLARSKLRQKATFGELRDRFELVLVDAGCIGVPSSQKPGILQSGALDAVILVGRETGERIAWTRARRALAQWNVPCRGAIENRCPM